MPDLMTAGGRTAMIKSLTPNLSKIESTLARQSKPLLKTLRSVDGATLAKLGGGVAAFAAIFYAAQSLLTGKKPATKAAAKVVKAAKGARKTTATRGRRKPAARTRKAA